LAQRLRFERDEETEEDTYDRFMSDKQRFSLLD
jgi:hypothetical protein